MNKETLVQRAKKKAKKQAQLRQDPRFQQVMGRLQFEGYLGTNNVTPHRKKFLLDEALWVGENIEPRVLELLPAIIIKHPGILLYETLPQDLNKAINNLRRGLKRGLWRGIPLKKIHGWLPHIGRKGQLPMATKTIRLSQADIKILKKLSQEQKVSETEVIRKALHKFHEVKSK